jgi:hypothetical protein
MTRQLEVPSAEQVDTEKTDSPVEPATGADLPWAKPLLGTVIPPFDIKGLRFSILSA